MRGSVFVKISFVHACHKKKTICVQIWRQESVQADSFGGIAVFQQNSHTHTHTTQACRCRYRAHTHTHTLTSDPLRLVRRHLHGDRSEERPHRSVRDPEQRAAEKQHAVSVVSIGKETTAAAATQTQQLIQLRTTQTGGMKLRDTGTPRHKCVWLPRVNTQRVSAPAMRVGVATTSPLVASPNNSTLSTVHEITV